MRFGFALTILALPHLASAGEFQRVSVFGHPVIDRRVESEHERLVNWSRHIDHAAWVDDDKIVFATQGGSISCLAVNTNKLVWSVPGSKELRAWSVSRATRRLAYLDSEHRIVILDCRSGKELFNCDSRSLARLLDKSHVVPSRIALNPTDGRLILLDYSRSYGRHGYVLNAAYRELESSFNVDASVRELSVSHDGTCIAVIGDKDILSVRHLADDKDLFLVGQRVLKEEKSISSEIGPPFLSHVRHDGANIIVATIDGGCWQIGQVSVLDIAAKGGTSFSAGNTHIELDVNFPARRIILTGTSNSLTLTDFSGKELIHVDNLTKQRNTCVEFSPTGDRILVGSWDSTVSVYKIHE